MLYINFICIHINTHIFIYTVIFAFYCVVVNFMCQLNWTTGCLDIWSNVNPCVSVKVFWMRLTFKWKRLGEQITIPNVLRPHSISWKPELNQKTDPHPKQEIFPPAQLHQTKILALSSTSACQSSDWNWYHEFSWFWGLQTQRNSTINSPGLQLSSLLIHTANLRTSQDP